MTRKRLYIQKYKEPNFDLWLELEKSMQEVPVISLCCNDCSQKSTIVGLTIPTAIRMVNALNEFIEYASRPVEDYAVEEDPDD